MGVRDSIFKYLPVWLRDGVAERFVYNMALAQDAVLEKATQAVHARMPLKANADALPYIGQDRLIPQGLTEAATSYAILLQRAFDDWRIAGNAWSVLRQVRGYLLANSPVLRTVSSKHNQASGGAPTSSQWNTFDTTADGTQPPTHKVVSTPGNWNWDGTTATTNWGWWRWFLIVFSTGGNAWCAPAPFKWGAAGVKWGTRPDVSWGLNVPSSTVLGIQKIVGLFQAAGSWCRWIIVSFDDTLFDPAQPSGGAFNPDGTWGTWSKVVSKQYVPARSANARYCDGVF